MHGIWLISYGLMWLLLVVMAGVLLTILRRLTPTHSALGRPETPSSPGAGTARPIVRAAPDVPLWSEDGKQHHLADYLGRPLLLVFSLPDCNPCQQLIPELNAFRRSKTAFGATVALITYCDPRAHRQVAAAYADGIVVLRLTDLQALATFGVPATPFAFFLDAAGVVRAQGLARRQEDLEALVTRGLLEQAGPERVAVGAPTIVA
jgi:peroxiredoxin